MFCGCQNFGNTVVLLGHSSKFPEAAVSAPILAKESAKLIFQGCPQLHFVGNQFSQWDVIYFDWAVKIIFLTLPCPFLICIPFIMRSVKVWCLNQMRVCSSGLGLRWKQSLYIHLHYLKNLSSDRSVWWITLFKIGKLWQFPSKYKEGLNLHLLPSRRQAKPVCVQGVTARMLAWFFLSIKALHSASQKLSLQVLQGPDSCGRRGSKWMPLQLVADSSSLLYRKNHISSTGRSRAWVRRVIDIA